MTTINLRACSSEIHKTFRISNKESFQKQNPWFSKNRNSGNPKNFAPKFCLRRPQTHSWNVSWQLVKLQSRRFDLQTENLSKVSKTFCFWWQKVWESPKTCHFQKKSFQNTHSEKIRELNRRELNHKRKSLEVLDSFLHQSNFQFLSNFQNALQYTAKLFGIHFFKQQVDKSVCKSWIDQRRFAETFTERFYVKVWKYST